MYQDDPISAFNILIDEHMLRLIYAIHIVQYAYTTVEARKRAETDCKINPNEFETFFA